MLDNLVKHLVKDIRIMIKGEEYNVKTKTFYSIEEDKSTSYIKCELTQGKCLVIIPDEELMYIGKVIPNLKYEIIDEEKIKCKGKIFNKTGEGHQFINNIEFGNENEVEGKCIFKDFESENNIISLGILPDKENMKADVYADILTMEDVTIK